MTISTSYQKNQNLMTDFHHVVSSATNPKRVVGQRVFYSIFGVLGISCGALLLALAEETSNYIMAVLGLLFGVYFAARAIFYYQYLGFFSARVMTKQIDEVTYRFEDDVLVIDDAVEHCEHPYHVVQGIYESKRTFVILITNRVGYIIAKNDLTEEEMLKLRNIFENKFEVPLVYYDV